MKSTGNREIDDLQMRYQELSNRTSGVFATIGKMYYEKNSDNPDPEFAESFAIVKDAADQMKNIDIRIKFLNGIVVCSECGQENSVNSSFCAGCGARLPHTFANDGVNRCSNCGNVVAPGQKFCGTCGALVKNVEAEQPKEAEQAVGGVCPSCGAKIEEEDSLFCQECGAKLK